MARHKKLRGKNGEEIKRPKASELPALIAETKKNAGTDKDPEPEVVEDKEQKDCFGRPTVMVPEIIRKLEEAAAWGCTDIEMCLHAGIGRTTFYEYIKVNPDFQNRIDELREQPTLRIRANVVTKSERNPFLGLKYLSLKKNKEFSTRVHTEGTVIPPPSDEEKENIDDALDEIGE